MNESMTNALGNVSLLRDEQDSYLSLREDKASTTPFQKQGNKGKDRK